MWGAVGAQLLSPRGPGGSLPRRPSEAIPAGTASCRGPLQRRRRTQQEQALLEPRPQPGASDLPYDPLRAPGRLVPSALSQSR